MMPLSMPSASVGKVRLWSSAHSYLAPLQALFVYHIIFAPCSRIFIEQSPLSSMSAQTSSDDLQRTSSSFRYVAWGSYRVLHMHFEMDRQIGSCGQLSRGQGDAEAVGIRERVRPSNSLFHSLEKSIDSFAYLLSFPI